MLFTPDMGGRESVYLKKKVKPPGPPFSCELSVLLLHVLFFSHVEIKIPFAVSLNNFKLEVRAKNATVVLFFSAVTKYLSLLFLFTGSGC